MHDPEFYPKTKIKLKWFLTLPENRVFYLIQPI